MVFGGVTEFYNSTSGQATLCMGRARQLERVDDRVPTHKMGATNSALAATTTVVTSYGTARAHPVKPIDPTPFDLPRPGSFLSYHKTDTRRLTRIKNEPRFFVSV
ncbi:hypothetical protein HZH68_016004 [Vespula germanica]|uniref:Uncharacterized protein n=3 Tax=Vespula TaxID=7451 RepID=A0A834J3P1_VESGE|nr:hypothetical protein HZH66_014528 [Vespula vulgaris]KAF7381129.1 hypothetical protein HZH68_016004 [Vespula germanica]KAF7392300.1 hypothetical protein H0235_017299 [Vespula pensylvanica]